MAEDIQGLLEKLQRDGVDNAKKKENEIIEAAKVEAAKIVKEAEVKAEKSLAEAKVQAEKLEEKVKETLNQASRDVIISLKKSIEEAVEKALTPVIQSSMGSDSLAKIIQTMVKGFSDNGLNTDKGIEVFLSDADLKALEGEALTGIKKEVGDNLILKPVKSISGGIQIGISGTDAKYDVTAETVTEMICSYLNPTIVNIIKAN